MAMRIGAGLGNMREAWWAPTIDVDRPGLGRVPYLVNGERSRPHSIMVNRAGRRFANESANYNAFGAAFHYLGVSTYDYSNHPAWLLFDDYYMQKFGLAGYFPLLPHFPTGSSPRIRSTCSPRPSTFR